MRARIAVALCAALVLVAGGVVWWSLQGDSDQPGATITAPNPPEGSPVAACASAQPSDRIPDSFWGMHVASPIGDDFPDAPIGAVNLTTTQVYWNQVEVAPGSYDFARLDDIVSTSEDRRAQPMTLLGFTPSFHASSSQSSTPWSTMPDESAWRAWVTAVVERYGDQLDYQVWPEPNIVGNWAGTPEQMGRLTAIAGEIIHDRAPDALVVAPATVVRLEPQREWMDRFWATEVAGVPVAESVDAVALDPFPLEDGTPEDTLDMLCQAQEILAERGVDLPVWTNEINYGVPSGGNATDVQHYPDGQQAAVVARTYLLHAALGIDRVYWLGWGTYGGMAVELERDGATTPAGRAYATVHEWLAERPRPVCRVDEGVYTCLVNGDENLLRIHWRERGTSTVPAGDGVTLVETLTGESRRLEPGDVVRVDQTPVALVEPSRP